MICFGVGKITVRCYLRKTAIIQFFYDFSRYFFATLICRKDTLERKTKAERTIACGKILNILSDKIKKRIDLIVTEQRSNRAQDSMLVSPSDVQQRTPTILPHEIHLAVKRKDLRHVIELVEQDPRLIHVVDAFNQTPLLWAAFKGEHKIVTFLIEKGTKVNQVTKLPRIGSPQRNHNNTPLDWAIIGEHDTVVDTLLQAGAVSNNQRTVLLSLMIKANNITQVQTLIERDHSFLNQPNQEGYTPLHVAAFFSHMDIFRYLLHKKADLNICTPRASKQYINIKYPNQTAIDIACQHGNDLIVISLFEAGAIVTPTSERRPQPIHVFAKYKATTHYLERLVRRCPEFIHAKDHYNQTPLLWAASKGHSNIAKFLIAKGANVNIPTKLSNDHKAQEENNRTPLDWAIICGHTDTILTLIDAKAIANHQHTTFKNKTLKELIEDNDFISTRILIKSNPSLLNKLSDDGYAPLHYAAIYGHADMIHFLISLEANIHVMTFPLIPKTYHSQHHHRMTTMELWSVYHPRKTNPMNHYYCRIHDLEQRKTQIVTFITSEIPAIIWRWWDPDLHNQKAILEELKQEVRQLRFKPTDCFDKTADDILNEMLDRWEHKRQVEDEYRHPYESRQNGFFSHSNDLPKRTTKVLEEIRSILRISLEDYSNI